jgi:hypothetical protein
MVSASEEKQLYHKAREELLTGACMSRGLGYDFTLSPVCFHHR